MIGTAGVRRWMVVWVAAAMLGGVALGCGDDDDSTADEAGSAADAREIKANYKRLVDAFYAPDPQAGCAMLTRAAKQEFAAREPARPTCEKRFALASDPRVLSENRPFVVGLRMKGDDRATLLVKTKNSLRYRVPFAKEGGEWKVAGL